jgi:hypothetical protein
LESADARLAVQVLLARSADYHLQELVRDPRGVILSAASVAIA